MEYAGISQTMLFGTVITTFRLHGNNIIAVLNILLLSVIMSAIVYVLMCARVRTESFVSLYC